MSAIPNKSENKELVFFTDYLQNRPTGKDSPITIKAADLDNNFAAVTVVEDPDLLPDDRFYTVEYEQQGTFLRFKPILPDGTNDGDLLYWKENKWIALPAPQDNTLRALTIQNGTLTWLATEDC
jgi:hypothetical protein